MCSLSDAELTTLLDCLDGSGSDQEWDAAIRLHELLGNDLPSFLLPRYRSQKHWGPRASYVYHALKYAKESEYAIELGKLAINDRSKPVRYRACMLLACSLRRELLPYLEEELAKAKDEEMKNDLIAVMDAIIEQNHNFFVDRKHTGKVKLNVG